MGLNVNQDEDFFEKSGLVNAASLYTLTGNKYDKMLCGGVYSGRADTAH